MYLKSDMPHSYLILYPQNQVRHLGYIVVIFILLFSLVLLDCRINNVEKHLILNVFVLNEFLDNLITKKEN